MLPEQVASHWSTHNTKPNEADIRHSPEATCQTGFLARQRNVTTEHSD